MFRIAIGALVVLMVNLLTAPLQAAEWSVQPALTWLAQYQDNLYMSSEIQRSVTSTTLDGRLDVTSEGEVASIQFAPHISATQYQPERQLSYTSYGLDLVGTRDFEYSRFQVRGSLARESTLTSELTDTGFIQDHKWLRALSLAPSWEIDTSESGRARFGFSYVRHAYDGAENTPLAGYDVRSLDYTYTRTHGERLASDYTATLSRLMAPRSDTTNDDGRFNVGLNYDASENLSAAASVGGHRFHNRNGANSLWRSGAVMRLQLALTQEFGVITSSLSRTVEPSGYGLFLQRDVMSIDIQRQIGEQWSGALSLQLNRDHEFVQSRGDANRRYSLFSWRLAHQIGENLSVNGSVSYRRQRYDLADTRAEGSSVVLQVVYRPAPKKMTVRDSSKMEDVWN